MFEWDEAKRAANLAKHGVDFAAVHRLDWSSSLTARDGRTDYGEDRHPRDHRWPAAFLRLDAARRPAPDHQSEKGEPT